MRKIEIFYPSFTRKALTFTIDDGNMTYDKKLLEILAPAGIRGTFNLCSHIHEGREAEAVAFYSDYDVANHCKYHPLVNFDGVEYVISDDAFDEATADKTKIYRVDGREGFYWLMRPNGWRQMIFEDDFISCVRDGQEELEAIFKGRRVKDFVWPYGEQNNAAVRDFIKRTHRSSRKTGCTKDKDGFAIPKDKYAWSYNADDSNLLDVMAQYDAYPDDGGLKFFAFGVHSIDFERREGGWDMLKTFAAEYGNRPDTYWYTTVGEVFDYEEAVGMLESDNDLLTNHADVSLYLTVDGERTVLEPGAQLHLN